jgi:Mlc titration factor MtfA (ptsG expression regulator)
MEAYYVKLMAFFVFGSLIFLSIYLYLGYRKKQQLKRIEKIPFKPEHRKYLRKTPHYEKLSEADKKKIEASIIRFTYTKEFIGVKMDITDEIKIVTAFYACLLLLHKETNQCYDALKTIIVYPTPVVLKDVRENGGIYTKEDFIIDGQSSNDTVILVWHDAKHEAYHLRHDNVVIHEFAHEIDFMDGEVDGVPPMEASKYNVWTSIFFEEYEKLHSIAIKDREWGKYKILGSYAATNEAEFFAVVTERFFESPHSLHAHFPELYKELKDFYEIDTLALVSN